MNSCKEAWEKTGNNLKRTLPILTGVILLISMVMVLVPASFYQAVFIGHKAWDSLIGALVGSLAAGNPVNSYVISGELMDRGIGLIAITAFIISWVTVGLVQLPAESLMLGRRFAIVRSLFCFVSAIIIAFLTVFILNFL
ncbi:MAG TPA: hypothetical protein VKP03_02150 [Patescibacteria group bacterium]|nr:hypothetical protein [Patescibacteria group bacterium]